MEDNLKILKVEYLSNPLLEHTQILALSLDDLTIFLLILKMKSTFNGRQPQNMWLCLARLFSNCFDSSSK